MTVVLPHETQANGVFVEHSAETMPIDGDERIGQVASVMTARTFDIANSDTTSLQVADADPTRDRDDDSWDGGGWS